MNDRELLELAAKAAGYNYRPGNSAIVAEGIPSAWNPLTDDGDALRLAVNCGTLNIALAVGQLVLAEGLPSPTSDDEKMAFVRRAIVCDVVRRATQASEKP